MGLSATPSIFKFLPFFAIACATKYRLGACRILLPGAKKRFKYYTAKIGVGFHGGLQ